MKQELLLFINNWSISQVKNTTFIGLVIDEYLTWKDHIDVITKKVIKSAGIIANNSKTALLYQPKYFEINILCFSLSISYLWQPTPGKYIQKTNPKTFKYSKKNCTLDDV